MTIKLADIAAGDEVMIQDRHGYRLRVPVRSDGQTMSFAAFGRVIPFARHLKSGWQHCDGMRVIEHQPSFDLVMERPATP